MMGGIDEGVGIGGIFFGDFMVYGIGRTNSDVGGFGSHALFGAEAEVVEIMLLRVAGGRQFLDVANPMLSSVMLSFL